MSLLYLVPTAPERETIALLRAALERALKGKTTGVLLTEWQGGGAEATHYTGPYRSRRSEGVRAALQASITLTRLEEIERGAP